MSGFADHIAISGCQLLSPSLVDTFFELAMIIEVCCCNFNFIVLEI